MGLRSQWTSAEIHLSALKVLFYAGMLTIAMIIDRGHGLDLDKLIVGLQNESELITRQADACCDPRTYWNIWLHSGRQSMISSS